MPHPKYHTYHNIPHTTLLYHAMPYHSLPWLTIAYHTLPYHFSPPPRAGGPILPVPVAPAASHPAGQEADPEDQEEPQDGVQPGLRRGGRHLDHQGGGEGLGFISLRKCPN